MMRRTQTAREASGCTRRYADHADAIIRRRTCTHVRIANCVSITRLLACAALPTSGRRLRTTRYDVERRRVAVLRARRVAPQHQTPRPAPPHPGSYCSPAAPAAAAAAAATDPPADQELRSSLNIRNYFTIYSKTVRFADVARLRF